MTETQYAALRLVRTLKETDDRAVESIYDYARVLPPAAFFTVRSQLAIDRKRGRQREIRNETGYALGCLRRMVVDRQYVRAS